jgi:hypothetical protein
MFAQLAGTVFTCSLLNRDTSRGSVALVRDFPLALMGLLRQLRRMEHSRMLRGAGHRGR